MILELEAQKARFSRLFPAQVPEGFNWDKLSSTAGSAPTTNAASARNATSEPSPGAQVTKSLPCSRRRRPAPTTTALNARRSWRWPGRVRLRPSWSPSFPAGVDRPRTWCRPLMTCMAGISVLAQNGLSFDLSTSTGKLMRTIMAGLAEFERDLIRERVRSGLAAARARGVALGRQIGQRPSDKKAKRVLAMHRDGLSYRLIGRNLGLSKNTVMEIVRREAVS